MDQNTSVDSISNQLLDTDQSPLFNLNYLHIFKLVEIDPNSTNKDWDKIIDDFFITKYYELRQCFINKNYDGFLYFINCLEAIYLITKSDLMKEIIFKIKKTIQNTLDEKLVFDQITKLYINLVNVHRIYAVGLIQILYNYKIKLNKTLINQYLTKDTELDEKDIQCKGKLIKYTFIKQFIVKNITKIGKYSFILDYDLILKEHYKKITQNNDGDCIIF